MVSQREVSSRTECENGRTERYSRGTDSGECKITLEVFRGIAVAAIAGAPLKDNEGNGAAKLARERNCDLFLQRWQPPSRASNCLAGRWELGVILKTLTEAIVRVLNRSFNNAMRFARDLHKPRRSRDRDDFRFLTRRPDMHAAILVVVLLSGMLPTLERSGWH